MHSFDFSPLFRSTVGFDRFNRMFDTAFEAADTPSYPPYNIEKDEDHKYRITMAVAGFGESDIEVTQQENALLVVGKGAENGEDVRYLHRGIAGRAFQRRFALADHVSVTSANLENGLLVIELERELPEEMKPRLIPIAATGSAGRKAKRGTRLIGEDKAA